MGEHLADKSESPNNLKRIKIAVGLGVAALGAAAETIGIVKNSELMALIAAALIAAGGVYALKQLPDNSPGLSFIREE
jgi:hypothetical protein